jgi:tetratricopeptide (TPR) repeat protein
MATIESPDQARTVLEAASAADAAHDYAEVISLLTELVDSDHLGATELPRVRWMLAEAQFNTGALTSARGNYEILQNLSDPDFAEGATGRLKLLAGEVAADQAVADGEVEGLTEINQVLPAATLQLSQGRFEESLELFSQAYRSDDLGLSQAVAAGFGIARSLAGLGRWAEAKEYTDYLRYNAVGTEFEEGVAKLADQADLQVGAALAADDGVSGREIADQLHAAQGAFEARDYNGASDLYYRVYQLDLVDGQTKALCAYWIGECFVQTQAYEDARAWLTEATNATNLGFARDATARLAQLDQLAAGQAIVDNP